MNEHQRMLQLLPFLTIHEIAGAPLPGHEPGQYRGLNRVNTPPPAAGRNQQCPCGSGKKYKKCCLAKRG